MFNRLLKAAPLLVILFSIGGALADEPSELMLSGKVENGQVVLTRDTIAALPQISLTEQHISMEKAATFRGPYLSDVLKLAKANGQEVTMTALDDYVATASMEEIEKYQPILAIEMDGKRLVVRDFGPFFVVWPFSEYSEVNTDLFHARAVWQLVKIEVE